MGVSAEKQVEKILIQEILSGKYKVNQYLPPERTLAEALGFSRPVVHKAIIRMESKGLVSIVPRQGIRVNDYRVAGKLELLEVLYEMYMWKIDVDMHRAIIMFVKDNLTRVLLDVLGKSIDPYMENCHFQKPEDLFLWMHQYTMYSSNILNAMLFNEFKTGITNVCLFLLHEKESNFQELRMRIDAAIKNGDKDLLLGSTAEFFKHIEDLWIRRCEYEVQSRS